MGAPGSCQPKAVLFVFEQAHFSGTVWLSGETHIASAISHRKAFAQRKEEVLGFS